MHDNGSKADAENSTWVTMVLSAWQSCMDGIIIILLSFHFKASPLPHLHIPQPGSGAPWLRMQTLGPDCLPHFSTPWLQPAHLQNASKRTIFLTELWGLNQLTHRKCLEQYLAQSKHPVNLHWFLQLDLLPTTGLFEISRWRRGRLRLHGIAFSHRKDEAAAYHLVIIKTEMKSNQNLADRFFNSHSEWGDIKASKKSPFLSG